MTRRAQDISGVVCAQALLGTIGLCVVESGADPVSVTFYRCAIGAAVLGLYCAWRGTLVDAFRLPVSSLLLVLASGILMAGNWVLFFEGIHRTSIAVATILFHIQPFFVVVLGAIFFQERLRAATFLWISAALFGLTLSTGMTAGTPFDEPSTLTGIACIVAAAFLYALVTIIAKGVTGLGAPQLAFLQFSCGAILLSTLAPLSPSNLGAGQWSWLVTIGIVHTGGVYVLLYTALPKLTTPVIAVLLFVYPASAVLVDALFYGRMISAVQLAGFVLIMISSLGVTLNWGTRPKCIRSGKSEASMQRS